MAAGKLAVLSNVNMNMVIRMLQKQAQVYETEGYGNELGVLLNPASSYHTFQPDITFFIMDLAELLEHNFSSAAAEEKIADWFGTLDGSLTEKGIYYISDAYLWAVELSVLAVEYCTGEMQRKACQCKSFPLSQHDRAAGIRQGFFPENVVYGQSIAWHGSTVGAGAEAFLLCGAGIPYPEKGTGTGSGQYAVGRTGGRSRAYAGAVVRGSRWAGI